MAEINLHGDAIISREWAAGKQELHISCAGMRVLDLQACRPQAVRVMGSPGGTVQLAPALSHPGPGIGSA